MPKPRKKAAAVRQLSEEERGCTAFVLETHQSCSDPTLRDLAHAPDSLVEHARCVVLAHGRHAQMSQPSGHDKTILHFTLEKTRAGSLAAALNILHRHGVNMSEIRSFVDNLRDR